DKSKRYLEDYSNAATDTFSNIETALNSSFSSMENTLVEFVTKGKASFKDFANSVISDISRVLIRQSITGPLSTWMGDVFSPAQAEVNINAKGGIFSGAGISAYSSSIVDTPTMFPFAKGIGLMGEAGAEAILPLTRTSGGELGVRAKNESSNVSVQIIDQRTNSNAQNIQTEESEGVDGQKILRVMIRDEIRNSINNGALDTTFKGNMGISRRPIRR
ncbi:MAG: phage tail tape measure protein, partial [Clostridia bacterium]|nr:phage tail tape measure protein [Clostridia bacterium]